jgi:hypothetical protein
MASALEIKRLMGNACLSRDVAGGIARFIPLEQMIEQKEGDPG